MKLIIEVTEDYYSYLKERADNLKANVSDITILGGKPYEERPQGKWIKHSTYKDVLICSNCNHGSNQVYDTFNFCPNCGADMRKEADDG